DGRYTDRRPTSEPLLQLVIFSLAVDQALPPTIIVNDDVDVVRVVERRGAPRVSRLVEAPFRRGGLPDQPVEVVAVLLIADPAAFGREIELVPPLQLRLGRQRHLAGLLIADQISADGNQRVDPLR